MKLFLPTTFAMLLSTGIAAADAVADCADSTLPTAQTVAACTTILETDPSVDDRAQALARRGAAHHNGGAHDLALADYAASLALDQSRSAVFYNQFLLQEQLDDTAAARATAEAAIAALPEEPFAYAPMMALSVRGGDSAECAPTMEAVLTLLPDPADWAEAARPDHWFMTNLGDCLYYNQRDAEAVTAFETAIALGQDDAYVYYSLALPYFYLESLPETERYLRLALERDPSYVRAISALVQMQTSQHNFSDAVGTLTEHADILDASSHDAEIRNHVAWFLTLSGDYDSAAPLLEAWLAWAEPRMEDQPYAFGGTFDTLAQWRAATGDVEGAVEAFRLAIEHDGAPEDARASYRTLLTALGFEVGEGNAALLAALEACAETGPACQQVPEGEGLDSL